MCESCWRMYGSPQIVNEKTTKMAKMIDNVYAIPGNECGGVGHIVFDDMNYEDDSIEWCIEHAHDDGESGPDVDACLDALRYMLGLTIEERASAEYIRCKLERQPTSSGGGFVILGVDSGLGWKA